MSHYVLLLSRKVLTLNIYLFFYLLLPSLKSPEKFFKGVLLRLELLINFQIAVL